MKITESNDQSPWFEKGLLSEIILAEKGTLAYSAVVMIEEQYAFLLGIDDLADQLEVSKPHLIRTFTAATGISPGRYLTYIRISHAKYMLYSDIDVTLEVIAGTCGYSSANYFSKVFKKHTGLTAREYASFAQEKYLRKKAGAPADLLPERLYL
jgi:transcriptional regulator GlxA family with amidase domain